MKWWKKGYFCHLEKNLFKIDKKEIKDVKVEQTYVAGNCVFMIK